MKLVHFKYQGKRAYSKRREITLLKTLLISEDWMLLKPGTKISNEEREKSETETTAVIRIAI